MSTAHLKTLLAGFCFAFSLLPLYTLAQETGATAGTAPASQRATRGTLEEVIVTARRREEALQDTPIAITAISGDALRARGIVNIENLTQSVPSLEITKSVANLIYIRGVGQRTAFARVDPTVGVYMDDLFLPRVDSALMDTVDVRNIQVLRGPQGTLFGKNTTGGAIIMSLEKPHEQYEGYVQAGLGNFGSANVKVGINFPVTDRFFARLALNLERDDGFFRDVSGDTNSQHQRQSALLQMRWEPTADITLDTLTFFGRIRERLAGTNCTIANEDALFIRGLWVAWPGDTDPSNPTAYRENCESNSPERLGDLRMNLGDSNKMMNTEVDTIMQGITLDWQLSDNHSLKSVASLRDEWKGPILTSDNDGGPANLNESYNPDDQDRRSYSLELQLSGGLFDRRLRYTLGAFSMYEENFEPFLLLTGLAGLDAQTVGQLALGEIPTQPPPGGTMPMVGILSGPITFSEFELQSTTLAAFFQSSYDITTNLELTVGVRWTQETRQSRLGVTESDAEAIGDRIAQHPLFGPAGGGFNPFLGGWANDPVQIAHDMFTDETGDGIVNFPMQAEPSVRDRRKEDFRKTTPMASLAYSIPSNWIPGGFIDNAMIYATWSTGFKSGFFEPRLLDGLQRVEPEELENREFGFKIEALERSLSINAAFYSMQFDNQQHIQVKTDSAGNLAVIFDNAAESKIEGGELEIFWFPTPNMQLNFSASKNRYQFTDFSDNDLLEAVVGNIVEVDRSDEPFPVSPEETMALGMQYSLPTGIGIFTPRVDVSYKSEIFYGLDRGAFEAYRQDKSRAGDEAYWLANLRFTWANNAGDTTVTGFVNNVTDERFLVGIASVGDSVATFFQTYGRPRSYGVQLRKTF